MTSTTRRARRGALERRPKAGTLEGQEFLAIGPGSATEILNLYAYRTSFTELNLGYGAALAVVLLSITLAISWLMFRLRRKRT